MNGRDDPAKTALIEAVVAELAGDAARSYRIDLEAAKAVIAPLVQADLAMLEAMSRKGELKELRRMRAYKDAAKTARRAVYTHLRRYKREEGVIAEATARLEAVAPGQDHAAAREAVETILAAHVSTAERLGHRDAFFEALAPHLAGARTVLDVGAGVMPLMFPFEHFAGLQRYLALDKDRDAMRAVRASAGSAGLDLLEAQEWAISDGWDALADRIGPKEFDVALLLKLIPVVSRIEPKHLDVLASTPATTLIASGSVHALAKRQSIMHREAGSIRLFCTKYGFSVVDRFKTEDEVFFVIRK